MSDSARLAVVAAILALPLVGYGVLADEDGLIHFFPDDAFYYLQPAVNLRGRGLPASTACTRPTVFTRSSF